MDFKVQLKKYQEQVNNELEKYSGKKDVPEKILNNSMEYSLMAGGKRLRPILVIATYEIFGKNINKCIPYAVAIEMVHNFSLIHDDLPGIDNDDFRHGKPTNHKKFNEATAILAGDGLLNQAYIVISEDLIKSESEELKNKLKVFNEFSTAVDRMIAGEYIDTEYEGKQITDEYLEYIHKNKTGALLKLCVRMGAILANANEKDLEKLTKYAEKIGLAFQIKDDILSEEGNEEILGKPVGNDKELEKCTYVSKYGLQGAKKILEEITKEAIKSGHKILLFSSYTSMLEIIEKRLKDENIKYFKLTGATKVEERVDLVDEFNNNNEIKVFLISLKAGGTGLNLTGADMVIHYDPWWNVSTENQATDRAYRIGQKNNVQVYKLITKNSIEEKIYKLQKKKEKLIDNVLDTKTTFINKLSKEDILSLFE